MATDAQLPEGLLRPDAYPHPVAQIRLRETHLSWVLLTGDYAYKIKKPVRFSFADFSTLTLRQHSCEEELRLNRRLAASLYLDVVRVTRDTDGLAINGSGDTVDYAVCMRQFPAGALLSDQIAANGISPAAIDELAARLALFHQNLPPAPAEQRWGSPESVAGFVRGNFTELSDVLHQPWKRASAALQDTVEGQIDRHWELLVARKRNGMVRECHGDLHLGNMFLDGDQITVFDGIEFNAALRWIDIINEVAFTVMDFEDRGHAAAGWRFLNVWLESTGDYAGAAVLPFYLCYRAMVRAKVAACQAMNLAPHAERAQRLAGEFDDYLSLAETYATSDRGAVLITCGLSGSGKTYRTRQILGDLRAIRIRSDVERKRLAANEPQPALYSDAMTDRTYGTLLEQADTILQAGLPAIVDATFLRQRHRKLFQQLADERNVPFVILTCDAAPELLRQRIAERTRRGDDASDATLAVLEQQLREREALTVKEQEAEIVCRNDVDFVSEVRLRCQRSD